MRRSGSNLSYSRNVASSFVYILLYYFWPGGANLKSMFVKSDIKTSRLIV